MKKSFSDGKRFFVSNQGQDVFNKGKWVHIKTTAFQPVKNEPFPIITSILGTQKFFEFSAMEGTLVGFYLPEYLNGINSKGFHFHFLSADEKHGGHVLDFTGKDLKIEIAELHGFEMETPAYRSFRDFKFKTQDNEVLKRVEQGQ